MPKLPGINHQNAVKAFEKAGFWIARQGKHITMTNGERIITIGGKHARISICPGCPASAPTARRSWYLRDEKDKIITVTYSGYIWHPREL